MIGSILSFLATVGVYLLSKRFYRRYPLTIFSPLVVCPLVLVLLLIAFHVPYDTYKQGGGYLSDLLQPATVALAVPVYRYKAVLKKYFRTIIGGVLTGSLVAMVTTMGLSLLFGLDWDLTLSLAPRSITTPIAMAVSEDLGGIPVITAVFVILTGVTSVLIGPALMRMLGVKNPVVNGLLLGIAAHGTGTAKAQEMGSLEGAVASVSMVLMAIITSIIAPLFVAGSASLFAAI